MDRYTCHTMYNVWRKLQNFPGGTDHSASDTAEDGSFHKTTNAARGHGSFQNDFGADGQGSDVEARFGFPVACFRMRIRPHRRETLCVCICVWPKLSDMWVYDKIFGFGDARGFCESYQCRSGGTPIYCDIRKKAFLV